MAVLNSTYLYEFLQDGVSIPTRKKQRDEAEASGPVSYSAGRTIRERRKPAWTDFREMMAGLPDRRAEAVHGRVAGRLQGLEAETTRGLTSTWKLAQENGNQETSHVHKGPDPSTR